jgi:hypothetical protein
MTPNTFVSGWGGSSNISEGSKTQLINFTATVKNDGHYPVFVRRVDSEFSETAHPRFLSGDKSIQIGEWLKPGEPTDIKGNWVFNVEGIEKNNIMTFANYVNFRSIIFP